MNFQNRKYINVWRRVYWPIFGLILLVSIFPVDVNSESHDSPYVGSEECGTCHQLQYKGWVKTFHSTVIQDARKNPGAILGDFSQDHLPFKKEDVIYTIGGHWDQRYLTKIGDDYYVLPRLWSVQSQKWRPYSTWAWKRRPYSKYCAGCHAVGYNPSTKEYAEHSVGCEACHGPGKLHVALQGGGDIVNPESLEKERADMICASCHVRGKDTTGTYFYPVGYVPGDDLSEFIVPLEKMEKESVKESIARLWNKWKDDREAQSRSRCEVCGIHTQKKPKQNGDDVNGFCMGCHEYGDRFTEHTHHGQDTKITCTDCHKQKTASLESSKENNVHSYSYFLIHPLNCWDSEIYKHCGKCHGEKGEKWAFDIFNRWRFPVSVDH